ncbi:hypothetical protein RFI_31435 [Reticulomyxa filosa]|uniref:phenylalanine 4-monooxygenase n=1 Tax=Reticulomyxa filosa TaxID=46433 RepID=X6LX99_RETFI|nr:hypothetical protein RFI_31435 [Reticulomyxa filosa]|eukprot:ETO05966.1 hypothetical protein RFI_31435 [Reticulomyxa filosa]
MRSRWFSLFTLHRRNLSQSLAQIHGSPSSQVSLLAADKGVGPRSTILFGTKDSTGALAECLPVFTESKVDMTKIESTYGVNSNATHFIVDMAVGPEDKRIEKIISGLQKKSVALFARQIPPRLVPWFPITSEEVNSLALLVLEGGIDLQNPEHPGFNDPEYRQRRQQIADFASSFQYGSKPERIVYTKAETDAWSVIWNKLQPLVEKYACDQYLAALHDMQKHCGYREDNIPQLSDVSTFIQERTGFRLRPTAGLLSARHFLNGLAFNTFFCTQYLRHPAQPLYTPEPDLVHELVGHAPLFADPEFARFSQEIGLASIGATDEQITALSRCYWFSVEFGLCRKNPQSKERKVYGAGILSSFGEIEYAMSDKPEIRDWDPFAAAQQEYPITTYQPVYYIAESFDSAKQKLQEFASSLRKPFTVKWDAANQKLVVDSNVIRQDKSLVSKGTYGDLIFFFFTGRGVTSSSCILEEIKTSQILFNNCKLLALNIKNSFVNSAGTYFLSF